MYSVKANVSALIDFNRSMAVALDKAAYGSDAEDMYFLEKLGKTAARLGFRLEVLPARMEYLRKERERKNDSEKTN